MRAPLLLLTVAVLSCETSRPPPGDAARGRALFERGRTIDGRDVVAELGPDAVPLTGRAAACAGCHGPTGGGTEEGGIAAPPLRAEALFRPREGRPAYDARSLQEAIENGISSEGRSLGPSMPRFQFSSADRADLLAHLRTLGTGSEPGVSDETIVLGTVLPLSGPQAEVGEQVRAVLLAALADVNGDGGLYRRRVSLLVEDAARPKALDRLLERGVLAVVASWPVAREHDERRIREGVPLVVPLGTLANDPAPDALLFSLDPPLETQARALVRTLDAKSLVLVHAEDEAGRAWARGIRAEADARSLRVRALRFEGSLSSADARAFLAAAGDDPVFFSGSAEDLAIAARSREPSAAPMLSHAVAFGRQHMQTDGELLFAVPHRRPSSQLEAFLARHRLSFRHPAWQAQAVAAVKLVSAALTRCGREVGRAKLVKALRALRVEETWVTPPATFGARSYAIDRMTLVRLDETSGRPIPVRTVTVE